MSIQAARIVGAGGNRHANDFYPTPKDVTFALLDLIAPYLKERSVIWEPACGERDMVNAIRERGYTVRGTDITEGVDFLKEPTPPVVSWIITNPPFSSAEAFIRRAYKSRLPFAMLVKAQFWHAAGRLPLFQECTPDIIAPLTWRPDFNFKLNKRGSPLMDVMWCIWLPPIHKTGTTRYIPLGRPALIKKEDTL